MKKYVLLHCGFEMPTPEIMQAWGKWFESIADRTVDNIGFGTACDVSDAGIQELPWGPDSITGCTIVRAEDMEEAQEMAKSCPYIAGIRVYEVRAR